MTPTFNDCRYRYYISNKYMSIVLAILVKNKGIFLPKYFECILNQTYEKKNIHLYIRTNDNTDDTISEILKFIMNHGDKYKSIYYNDKSINKLLKQYKEHEWNTERFNVLGKIRQDSIEYAISLESDYFVIDCDNFILPNVLEKMYKQRELGVIAPMLTTDNAYSNYHHKITENGYLDINYREEYLDILCRRNEIRLHELPVVHCTYFISNEILKYIKYMDDTTRHEYIIFSDILRKNNIKQYLDTSEKYGIISFSETKEQLDDYLKLLI